MGLKQYSRGLAYSYRTLSRDRDTTGARYRSPGNEFELVIQVKLTISQTRAEDVSDAN